MLEAQIKKLKYRCWHRSTREMDLILGPWFETWNGKGCNVNLQDLELLLEETDTQLYLWLSCQNTLPKEGRQRTILEDIKSFILERKI